MASSPSPLSSIGMSSKTGGFDPREGSGQMAIRGHLPQFPASRLGRTRKRYVTFPARQYFHEPKSTLRNQQEIIDAQHRLTGLSLPKSSQGWKRGVVIIEPTEFRGAVPVHLDNHNGLYGLDDRNGTPLQRVPRPLLSLVLESRTEPVICLQEKAVAG